MNKVEMITAVAEKTGMTKKFSGEVVDAVLETIKETMAAGEDVKIAKFGSFIVKDMPERVARNPQDGSEVIVKAHKSPKFKASSVLKEAVR